VAIIEANDEIARYSGTHFETREVVQPDPGNQSFMLSASGEIGLVSASTEICATPACVAKLGEMRWFDAEGPKGQLTTVQRPIEFHAFDNGMMLVRAALVDGPFDEEVELPAPKLLLVDALGQIHAEWAHDPQLSEFPRTARLEDGRLLVHLTNGSFDVSMHESEVVVVDGQAGTIEAYDKAMWPANFLEVDATGRRIVLSYVFSGEVGLAWGEAN
jgi:hypothetical protein